MGGVLLVFIVVIGVITYLEGCFTSIPGQHHAIPRHLVWLLEVPVLLSFFHVPLSGMGFNQLPIIIFLLSTVINLVICLGLVFSFKRYFGELKIVSDHIFWAFGASVAVCLWPIALIVLAVCAGAWLSQNPGAEPPEWIKFTLSPMAAFLVPVLLYLLFLAAMSMLKQKAAETLRRQQHLDRAALRPKPSGTGKR